MAFIQAIESGDEKVIEYLHTPNEYNYAFSVACIRGQLGLAKLIRKTFENVDVFHYGNFVHACKNGHIHVAKWLYDLNPSFFHECVNHAFRDACIWGYIDVVSWLYEIAVRNNIPIDIHDVISRPCIHGYIEVVKWLLDNVKGIDIHAYNFNAFLFACVGGHIHIMKWLYNLDPNFQNKQGIINDCFQFACEKGCKQDCGQDYTDDEKQKLINIAFWLYELGAEIETCPEFTNLLKERRKNIESILKNERGLKDVDVNVFGLVSSYV